MNARLNRIIDWLFDAGERTSASPSGANHGAPSRVLPRPEDRARYDSGTAFFGG